MLFAMPKGTIDETVSTAAITMALPFSVVMILIAWATVIAFSRERRAYERAERDLLIDRVGDYYGLEVEEPVQRAPRPLDFWRRRKPAGPPPVEPTSKD